MELRKHEIFWKLGFKNRYYTCRWQPLRQIVVYGLCIDLVETVGKCTRVSILDFENMFLGKGFIV